MKKKIFIVLILILNISCSKEEINENSGLIKEKKGYNSSLIFEYERRMLTNYYAIPKTEGILIFGGSYKYNKKGLPISRTDLGSYTYKFNYDKSNRLSKVLNNKNEIIKQYEYNPNGEIISNVNTSSNHKHKFIVNQHNQIVKWFQIDEFENIVWYHEYEYDLQGNLKKETRNWVKLNNVETIEYQYTDIRLPEYESFNSFQKYLFIWNWDLNPKHFAVSPYMKESSNYKKMEKNEAGYPTLIEDREYLISYKYY